MHYKQLSIYDATLEVIKKQTDMGGKGGLIALDRDGNVSLPFNTEGMYRGYITEDGELHVEIYNVD